MRNIRDEIAQRIWETHFSIGVEDPVLDFTAWKVQEFVCTGMDKLYSSIFSQQSSWHKILYPMAGNMEIGK